MLFFLLRDVYFGMYIIVLSSETSSPGLIVWEASFTDSLLNVVRDEITKKCQTMSKVLIRHISDYNKRHDFN